MNLYGYGFGDPINSADRSGLSSCGNEEVGADTPQTQPCVEGPKAIPGGLDPLSLIRLINRGRNYFGWAKRLFGFFFGSHSRNAPWDPRVPPPTAYVRGKPIDPYSDYEEPGEDSLVSLVPVAGAPTSVVQAPGPLVTPPGPGEPPPRRSSTIFQAGRSALDNLDPGLGLQTDKWEYGGVIYYDPYADQFFPSSPVTLRMRGRLQYRIGLQVPQGIPVGSYHNHTRSYEFSACDMQGACRLGDWYEFLRRPDGSYRYWHPSLNPAKCAALLLPRYADVCEKGW